MAKGTRDKKETEVLMKVLTAHLKTLVAAGSDETLLRQYSALLRFLRSRDTNFLESLPRAKHRTDLSSRLATLGGKQISNASLDDIDKLVNDEATARKDLEYIAIQRFSVPRGSMRSFSNKQMLVDKLRTLIGNERTHETIRAVARRQAKQTSDS
jgi:hypothetical protein